jgi:hypothetical protein
MGGYIIPVSGQRLGKEVPATTVTLQGVKRGVVYAVRVKELQRRELEQPVDEVVQGRVKKDGTIAKLKVEFCTGGCDKSDVTA